MGAASESTEGMGGMFPWGELSEIRGCLQSGGVFLKEHFVLAVLYVQLRACSGGVYGRAFVDFRKLFGSGARFYLEKVLIQYPDGAIIKSDLDGVRTNETASIFEAVSVLGDHYEIPPALGVPSPSESPLWTGQQP
jgi:hypothetical protein